MDSIDRSPSQVGGHSSLPKCALKLRYHGHALKLRPPQKLTNAKCIIFQMEYEMISKMKGNLLQVY